jgi:hypothetical protein
MATTTTRARHFPVRFGTAALISRLNQPNMLPRSGLQVGYRVASIGAAVT